MEKLIKKVLDRYNTGRNHIGNEDLARLIIALIKVGVDGKKGWYLNLNNSEGEYEKALNIIQEYQQ